MASSNSPPTPTTPNTTFVQADPSNFRAVVQKLTGASDHPSTPKLPLSSSSSSKKPLFKLHERRNHTAANKLSLSLSDRNLMMLNLMNINIVSPNSNSSSPSSISPYNNYLRTINNKTIVLASPSSNSPVSPLDAAAAIAVEEEEERVVIAEKGFYLRPINSPLGTPRASEPPELLPLFPLHSPNSSNQEHP